MQRRSFLAGLVATAAGLFVPARLLEEDPKRVYSFIRRPNAPKIRIYAGMRPSAADQAISDELMLAELEFTGSELGFVDYSANRTGTASWASYTDGAGRRHVLPIGVSEINGGIAMNTTAISAGAVVTCSELTITRVS